LAAAALAAATPPPREPELTEVAARVGEELVGAHPCELELAHARVGEVQLAVASLRQGHVALGAHQLVQERALRVHGC
jgi:hypothetical protein